MVSIPIELEGRILDAVGVAPWDAAEMRMLTIFSVVRRVVPAKYDVTLNAVGVIEKEV